MITNLLQFSIITNIIILYSDQTIKQQQKQQYNKQFSCSNMKKQRDEKQQKKNKPVNLPQISHSQSQPHVQHHPRGDFSLRFVHQHMNTYEPSRDKYLRNYFQKQISQKRVSQSFKDRKSAKTLPSQQMNTRREKSRPVKSYKLTSLVTEPDYKDQPIKQLSKQEFGNYMQMMRNKLSKR